MIRQIGCALLVTLLVACEKKEEPAPAATDTAAAAPAAQAPVAVAEPVIDLDTLPVEEEFEEEAEKEVTAATLIAKLDEVEKEIGAE
jgi:hypothetical protein